MKKERASLRYLFIVFSLIILLSCFVLAQTPGVTPTLPNNPSSAQAGVTPTINPAATSSTSNSMQDLWNSVKGWTSQATDWVKVQTVGTEYKGIGLNWEWVNSQFCAADIRENKGVVGWTWNEALVLIGARATNCTQFWIVDGLLALLTGLFAVGFAKIYVFWIGPRIEGDKRRKNFGGVDTTKIGEMLTFLSGVKFSGKGGWIKRLLGETWYKPILITALAVFIIHKIVIVKFVLWPLVIISSWIIAPIATGLWIVWWPIWSAIKEERRLKELEKATIRAGKTGELLGTFASALAEGSMRGAGKRMGGI